MQVLGKHRTRTRLNEINIPGQPNHSQSLRRENAADTGSWKNAAAVSQAGYEGILEGDNSICNEQEVMSHDVG